MADFLFRQLTEEEVLTLFNSGCCPFCATTEFTDGPTGGLSQNFYCTGCKAGFNICPGIPQWGGQLIQEPAWS